MDVQSPVMKINRLVLVGRKKNYQVKFHEGINIIFGDSDTGKSSILNLIDYGLGKSEVDLYQELEAHGKYILLEMTLKNKVYTIKRDIFSPKSFIEVYRCCIEDIDSMFPEEYGPDFNNIGPAGYYSDFLLKALNIPLIKIKQSPSKAESKLHRLSFRDIFKYCYLDQDEVGSKNLLDAKNFVVAAKNKETFKFIHNVLDTQITEIQGQISKLSKEKLVLEQEYETLSKFFRETQIDGKEKLLTDKKTFELEIKELENKIIEINSRMQSDTAFENELRAEIFNSESELNILIQKRNILLNQLDQYTKLKREYEINLEKFKLSINVKKSISSDFIRSSNCPLCNNQMELQFKDLRLENYDNETVLIEMNSLKNKIKELQILIESTRVDLENVQEQLQQQTEVLSRNKNLLDKNIKEYVSPYISQRDILFSTKNTIFEKIDRINYFLKLRKQVENINERITTISENITELNAELKQLKDNAPSIENIIINVSDYLKEFLEFIPIKNPFGIKISDKTFLPIVREKDYVNLTSGGLRTLVSVGYLFALLKNSLYSSTQLPSLTVIDTIGKYLGKTVMKDEFVDTDSEANEENLDDPSKYRRIYEYLYLLSEDASKLQKNHQIIIVDNDFPEELATEFDDKIIKKFSSMNKFGYDKGFIDNA